MDKAYLFVYLAERLFGDVGRPLRSRFVNALDVRLVGEDALGLLPYGTEELDDRFAYGKLEVAVAAALKLRLDLGKALSGGDGVNAHEVGYAGLRVGRIADAGLAVGDGPFEGAHYLLRLLHDVNAAAGILVRL